MKSASNHNNEDWLKILQNFMKDMNDDIDELSITVSMLKSSNITEADFNIIKNNLKISDRNLKKSKEMSKKILSLLEKQRVKTIIDIEDLELL